MNQTRLLAVTTRQSIAKLVRHYWINAHSLLTSDRREHLETQAGPSERKRSLDYPGCLSFEFPGASGYSCSWNKNLGCFWKASCSVLSSSNACTPFFKKCMRIEQDWQRQGSWQSVCAALELWKMWFFCWIHLLLTVHLVRISMFHTLYLPRRLIHLQDISRQNSLQCSRWSGVSRFLHYKTPSLIGNVSCFSWQI